MKTNEMHIKEFAKELLQRIVRDFDGKHSLTDSWSYDAISFAGEMKITFQHWAKDKRKPFFVILWRKTFIMEFDLARTIFHENGNITWILNRPTREKNRVILDELGYKLRSMPKELVEQIHSQMVTANKRANRTNMGYVFADNEPINKVLDKFSELIRCSIIADQKAEAAACTSKSEDLIALEGQLRESISLSRKRNRLLVEKAKKRDKHICQACGFTLKANQLYVVECHHKNPLNSERQTKLEDLVSLCPTCHRIAHKRIIPFTVPEIIRLRQSC